MAHEGYQPVDRTAEAWKLLARRWDWQPVIEDGEIVAVLIPSRSEPGTYWRVELATFTCGCPDFRYRRAPRGESCAHGIAAAGAVHFKRSGWTVREIVAFAEQMVAAQ